MIHHNAYKIKSNDKLIVKIGQPHRLKRFITGNLSMGIRVKYPNLSKIAMYEILAS